MIHISCAVEGDYVPHCAAMLHSVLANRGTEPVHVHYLHGPDLAPRRRDALRAMIDGHDGAAITFWDVPDERVAGLPTKGFTGKATWYRIFLPELLPDVDRILYLDSDLLVLDDLRPLWSSDLDGKYVGAVTNVLQHNHLHRPAALGLGDGQYFNAGVLLMNLELMRRDDCGSALLDYGVTNAGSKKLLEWRDQDALNVVLGDRRLALHPRWNCMNAVLLFENSEDVFGAEAVAEARTDPGIRHFEGPGPNKPWHYLCSPDLRELYRRHRAETPWPKVRLEGRTPANVLRRARSRLGAR